MTEWSVHIGKWPIMNEWQTPPPLSYFSDLINVEADRQQVGFEAILLQGDPDIYS